MPDYLDMEKENTHFFRIFKRVLLVLMMLVAIFLIVLTYTVLRDNPAYMHDWRGITCIFLASVALVLYALPPLIDFGRDYWPPPLLYAMSVGGGLYCSVFLLTLINNSFLWAFYVVIGANSGLFTGRRLLLGGCIAALTMFAFQGLLWPLGIASFMSFISQVLPVASIIGFTLILQNLIYERMKRNCLFRQLAQTNAELEEAHHRLAQSVVQQQELAILRERARLAREMHDTIGHALVLISVKLEAAQRLRERDPERCDHELESTKEIARGTMTTLRASIADLRSPALEHEQLYHVLRRSANELALRTGLHVTCELPEETESLPESLAETLWKVSQEAFTNIEKHAQAKNVEVEICRQDAQLCMRIHDDGIGLPPSFRSLPQEESPAHTGHYGLRGMLERVDAIGGHLALQSAQGQGTTIEIHLPLALSTMNI